VCVIGAKYFDGIGFVGVKNRDRNYSPDISFKYGSSNGIETLLFWDNVSQYCEGFNSNGVCILYASLMISDDDEVEITVRKKTPSKVGIKLKKALHMPNVEDAVKNLIQQKLPGNTIIFDKDRCYLLEGSWKPGGYKNRDYVYKVNEIPSTETVVRTNHGIWLDWAGYQIDPNNENKTARRISSESRKAIAEYVINKANTPEDMIDGLANTYVNNPQLNCLRKATLKKKMRTTSQLMIIPSDDAMFMRPIQCNTNFNFWKVNQPHHKLWIEILGNKKLHEQKTEIGS
jgi:hypothetical protein